MPASKTTLHFQIPGLIRQILTSWMFAFTIEYLFLPADLQNLSNLSGLARMSFPRILIITLLGTVLLFALSRRLCTRTAERWGMVCVFLVLAITSLAASFSWAFLTVCILIGTGLIIYGLLGWNHAPALIAPTKQEHGVFLWITAGLTVIFFLFVSAWTVGRFYSFSTPSFDFGIFSQMFYNMKESGLPMTTIERDGLLSHFRVHMSPIYYLMLPLYCLIPTPATLQVLQAAVIASSVIPLWKIAKHHGLPDWQRMFLCALLLLYPAFSGGTSYDLHENCFLTPLILWLFYGIDKKNTRITVIAGLLTLMVKEDAAVYVAVIALWLIIKTILHDAKDKRRDLIVGVSMLGISLIWFFAVTGYLAKVGDGVMTYRYDNFIFDGSSSLLTVVKSVILNPMKAVYECVDREKLKFILQTMLPLLGIPLLTRRYERYILLIPYLLVNLMSDYTYQHDIFFQYTFGSIACLLYLTVINLADWKGDWKRAAALSAAAVLSVSFFCTTIVPKATSYPVRCIRNAHHYQEIRDCLSEIPENASVSTTTFYSAYLSQREILYDVRYCTTEHLLSCDYVVLNISAENDFKRFATNEKSGFESLTDLLLKQGYRLFDSVPNTLVIYTKQ